MRGSDAAAAIQRFVWHLAPVAAAAAIALYIYTALSRATFPFELEWLEGGLVDHVVRILEGERLYVAPSLEFVPYIYVPGYAYVSAAVAAIFGASVFTLRAVSIVCSLALLAVLAAFVRRERGSWRDGLLAAGLFAATYEIGGAWLDIARIDSMFLLLLMGAIYLVRFAGSARAMALAGLLLTAALLTKQSALVMAPPLLLYAILRLGRRGAIAAAAFAVSAIASIALLDVVHDGWFLYYVFYAPMKQRVLPERYAAFWTSDLFHAFPVATAMGIAWCALAWHTARREESWFYILAGASLVGATWSTRVHAGAWTNTLIPAYLFLTLAAVRAAGWLDTRAVGAGSALVIVQLALLVYDPQRYIPSHADREAAAELQAVLRSAPGDVLVSDHGWFPRLAGKRTFAHEMAVRDVLLMEDEWGERLRVEYRRALETERFGLVVQDTPDWFPVPLSRYYQRTARIFDSPDVLWPRTGNRVRPEFIYRPRSAGPPAR
jgi:hypothetical protein